MKLSLFIALIAAVAVPVFLLAPANRPTKMGSGPRVAATFFPVFDLARNVAGDAVQVDLILPPGANPHTFDPTPEQVRQLAGAAAVYAIGHGTDAWIGPLTAAADLPVVTVDRGITLRPPVEPFGHDEAEEEAGGAFDPHYWLSLPNAKIISLTIAEDLAARFPDRAEAIRQNLAAYLRRLDEADAVIRERLAAAPSNRLVTFHDAWYYFAAAYGLEITGSFEPAAGREPTPQYLAELTAAVSRSGVRRIFTEPGSAPDAIAAFARDNALELRLLDPVEGTGPNDTYIEVMIRNAETISR